MLQQKALCRCKGDMFVTSKGPYHTSWDIYRQDKKGLL